MGKLSYNEHIKIKNVLMVNLALYVYCKPHCFSYNTLTLV